MEYLFVMISLLLENFTSKYGNKNVQLQISYHYTMFRYPKT